MRTQCWGLVLLAAAVLMPASVCAAGDQQAALVQRVIAIKDACQQQALVQGVLQDLASVGHPLLMESRPSDQALAVFAWQHHLFYVHAGLAEQWPAAQWSRQGVHLAGSVHRGTLDWADARPALLQWQQDRAPLLVPSPDCAQKPPRTVRRLRADLSAWIDRAALYKAEHEPLL